MTEVFAENISAEGGGWQSSEQSSGLLHDDATKSALVYDTNR
jgi:hypothetical protein